MPAAAETTTAPDTPRVAAVIPCYDYAEYVAAAIESALRQTRPYAQIVVVDDGSTDDSLEVIRRYADDIEIVQQENTGLLGACLSGLSRVRCEYVHFLDADDVSEPSLVQRVTDALVEHPVAPVKVQFQLAAIDEHGDPNGSVFPSYAAGYDRAAMMTDNRVIGLYQCPPTSGNVFHVETLRPLRLDREDPRLPLDGAGNVVMPYLGDVVSLSEPLAGYRIHGASMSMTQLLPTPEQCTREIADFEANWAAASRVMGHEAPPYADSTPLYLLERLHLRDAFSRRTPDVVGLARYLSRLAQSNLPVWQRTVQGVWMTTLLTPSPELRTRLVHVRRSGSARPEWMRRVISLVRRD